MSAAMLLTVALAIRPAPPIDCTSARHADARTFAESVIAGANSRWVAAFARRNETYAPPRTIFLCTPVGHPSRGGGYAAGVGLVLDLDDLKVLGEVLGPDAPGMVALLVAHELGHHVQALSATRGWARVPPTPPLKEVQADCLAGWTLREAAVAEGGPPAATLQTRMSRTLQVLEAVQSGGIALRRDAPATASHGSLSERVRAIERGYATRDPWRC